MREDLIQKIKEDFESEIKQLDEVLEKTSKLRDLDLVTSRFLGKKSLLTSVLKSISGFEDRLKPLIGKVTNEARKNIDAKIREAQERLKKLEFDANLRKEKIDISMPARKLKVGSKNIITQVIEQIEDVFIGMGYAIAQGPEIETDYYNFEALNHPADHPARSLHDTFFLSEDVLLRTHTSPMQIRFMEENDPPVYIIVPGKVYRKDYDVTHTPMFTQIEGLVVDEGINFRNLKWTLETFVHEIFGKERAVRFRPHYFPFTEPSAEVDVSCNMCDARGCRVCSFTGWLEILGAGMVDPNLYAFVGYDKEKVSGFAFGMGIERICMLKYGIDDLRLFFENDLRFLAQF
jgi:phenylalanyl-tRNA synthetase alpha chain